MQSAAVKNESALEPSEVRSVSSDVRTFDGVICFGGEDWWYHNRGHYDMQMMRELSEHVPVLYVNSIGMRVPRVGEGRMFVRRVLRKLWSLRRGFVRVRERFGVFSPVATPGRCGAVVGRRLLALQVKWASKRMGIKRPLVWVACPPGEQALEFLRPAGVVYQRTDRFEEYTGVDAERIRDFDKRLKTRADVTLFCSKELFDAEANTCARVAYIDHGVDYARFAKAGGGEGAGGAECPDDVQSLARPRVGFVGGIDSHTFDPALFTDVARQASELQFVLVGACSLPAGWCDLPNVALLGKRRYDEVPAYMAACDVLIMPWNQNDWIRACNPVKLKEYLAVGRPVVSTPFPELVRYEGLVRVASEAEGFVRAIMQALEQRNDAERGRARVCEHTWANKCAMALESLHQAGVVAASGVRRNCQGIGIGR